MLIDFFYTLRAAKLKVSPKEYLSLLEALQAGVLDDDEEGPTVDRFYVHARTALVKDETQFDAFVEAHKPVLTGQQFQGPDSTPDPVYILMEDFTHVKFYRRSFFDVVEDAEGGFEGFVHVDDWVPQCLVTATGPNPLPL